jgi:predicted nucleic acid-binding protein
LKYYDTSALIYAARFELQPAGVTRPHSLAEFYSFFSGGGFLSTEDGVTKRKTLPPKIVVPLAQKTFRNIKFQELTATDTFAALKTAAEKNILARNIHDYLHVVAAEKSGCKTVVTLNGKDFKSATKLKIVAPAEEFAI